MFNLCTHIKRHASSNLCVFSFFLFLFLFSFLHIASGTKVDYLSMIGAARRLRRQKSMCVIRIWCSHPAHVIRVTATARTIAHLLVHNLTIPSIRRASQYRGAKARWDESKVWWTDTTAIAYHHRHCVRVMAMHVMCVMRADVQSERKRTQTTK